MSKIISFLYKNDIKNIIFRNKKVFIKVQIEFSCDSLELDFDFALKFLVVEVICYNDKFYYVLNSCMCEYHQFPFEECFYRKKKAFPITCLTIKSEKGFSYKYKPVNFDSFTYENLIKEAVSCDWVTPSFYLL